MNKLVYLGLSVLVIGKEFDRDLIHQIMKAIDHCPQERRKKWFD